MSRPRISRRAAAALFLERQQLDRPRGRRLTAASLASLVGETGGLQLDSINVVDRAHLLTLWSRFGPFDRAKLDRLIYRKRVLFEYWSLVACLVATDHFPAWRRGMLEHPERNKGWLKKHGAVVKQVEAEVRARGPLGTADFEQPVGKRGAGWWDWKPAAHALEYLWRAGVISPHSRRHFHKRFDVIERVLPGPLSKEPHSPDEFRRWHMERSLHAMGAASETDLRMYITTPRRPVAERRALLRHMVHAGDITEVEVEGQRGVWYALTRDLPDLARAGRRRTVSRGTTFLCPFDSFLWHRERVQKLFGFDYRIEVYVPAPKRKYGYYVLPLLHDGHFIGRADVKNHRAHRVLEFRTIYFETWFVTGAAPPAASWGTVDRDEAMAGTAAAMRSLAAFVGAAEVKLGTVGPRALRTPLREALAAAAPMPAGKPPDDDAVDGAAEAAEERIAP